MQCRHLIGRVRAKMRCHDGEWPHYWCRDACARILGCCRARAPLLFKWRKSGRDWQQDDKEEGEALAPVTERPVALPLVIPGEAHGICPDYKYSSRPAPERRTSLTTPHVCSKLPASNRQLARLHFVEQPHVLDPITAWSAKV